jgi:hypothetical protein
MIAIDRVDMVTWNPPRSGEMARMTNAQHAPDRPPSGWARPVALFLNRGLALNAVGLGLQCLPQHAGEHGRGCGVITGELWRAAQRVSCGPDVTNVIGTRFHAHKRGQPVP